MPKLSAAMAKAVQSAEPTQGGFETLKPGKYFAKLREVDAREDRNGNPAWNVSFGSLRDLGGGEHSGQQFLWMGLPQGTKGAAKLKTQAEKDKYEKAEKRRKGQLRAFFDAFGYETNSDTDEFLDEECVLDIGVEKARAGKNEGQMVNRVNGVYHVSVAEGGEVEMSDGDADAEVDFDEDDF